METYPSKPAKQATLGTFSEIHREQGKRFFVDYFVSYGAAFGHEEFSTMSGMNFFIRQLQKGCVLDYGQIREHNTHGLISTDQSGLATSRSTH